MTGQRTLEQRAADEAAMRKRQARAAEKIGAWHMRFNRSRSAKIENLAYQRVRYFRRVKLNWDAQVERFTREVFGLDSWGF